LNAFTFFTFFSFVIYVYLSIYVFYLDRASRLNRVFVAMTTALAWKSFTYIFFHSAADPSECLYWYKMSTLGWYILPGVAIHYALILGEKEDWLKKWQTYLIIYSPGFLFIFNLWFGGIVYASDFVRRLNWSIIVTGSNAVHLLCVKIYFAIGSLFCLYSTWRLVRSHKTTIRQKKQADILSKTLLISAIPSITSDIILPLMKYHQLPQLAHIFVVFWMLGIWHAITRYRFMTITTALASDEIISKIFDILILTGPDGTIKSANAQALITSEYAEEELHGRPSRLLFRTDSSFDVFFNSDSIADYVMNIDLKTRSGDLIPLTATFSRIKDELGDIAGIVICGHDLRPINLLRHEVGERKAAEEKLQNAHDELEARVEDRTAELALSNEQLKEEMQKRKKAELEIVKVSKMESLGVLAGGIAHDFNNLLAGISNNISLAKMHSKGNDAVIEKLSGAEEVALRAKNLTAQFLAFSKGSALRRKITDISNLLKNCAEFTASGSIVKCEFDIASDLLRADIDGDQMNQVFTNLIINSIQAMPEGGKIMIKAVNVNSEDTGIYNIAAGKFVKISFKDNGPGIPPENISKIFDPYFTTKATGSGLGLTSVFLIIRNHEGHISVESQPCAGTVFHVYLPAVPEKAEITDAAAAGKSVSRIACKVLVMDDEPAIRNSVKEILELWGCSVFTAKDGCEAVDLFLKAKKQNEPFEILVFDLSVPGGMGGNHAMAEILKITPGVRAIASSGYVNDGSSADYRENGFRYFLQKPYRIIELNNAIQKLLNE